MRRPAGRLWLFLCGLVLAVALPIVLRGRPWQEPLYCVAQRGQVWGGAFGPVPEGAEPRCPQSASYRAEVRRGESRVEQYVLSGWVPRALLSAVQRAGWRQETDDAINAGTYVAFFEHAGQRLQYLARRTADGTEITLSGR